MVEYLQNLLQALRPAFSRRATFAWFVVAFAGFVVRNDSFGVCYSKCPVEYHPREFIQFRQRLDNAIYSQEAKHP